jgi:pilus assembly protein FimV
MTFRNALFILLLTPAIVLPAELGRLTVLSGVGEPLRAEIEIVSVQANEAASLIARIPPPEAYWRANIEPPALLPTLRATVERRPNGRHIVVLRSGDPISEPFLDILVELASSSGVKQREYTFLVEERVAPVTRPAPALRLPPQDGRAAEQTEIAAGLQSKTRAPGYIVRPGDTLAGIAHSNRPADASVEQAMVALFQANEAAFVGANMNRLAVGRALTMPDADTARTINPAEARRLVGAHRADFEAYRNRLANNVREMSDASSRSASGPVGATGAQQTAPATASQSAAADQLRLSRADESKAGSAIAQTEREDDTVAMQQALTDTRERLATLERHLNDMRQLLAVQTRQLAQVQQPGRSNIVSSRDTAAAEVPVRAQGTEVITSLNGPTVPVPRAESGVVQFVRDYWPWLVSAFILAFLAWVAMPIKTVRLWSKRRRRRARQARAAQLAT